MTKRKVALRSQITPFVKVVNYNHLMPTRYTLDISDTVKSGIDTAAFASPGANAERPEARVKSRGVVKKEFQQRYNAGKNRWFFTGLKF